MFELGEVRGVVLPTTGSAYPLVIRRDPVAYRAVLGAGFLDAVYCPFGWRLYAGESSAPPVNAAATAMVAAYVPGVRRIAHGPALAVGNGTVDEDVPEFLLDQIAAVAARIEGAWDGAAPPL